MTNRTTIQSLAQAGYAISVAEHVASIEAEIRNQPGVASHRWALFQWLCVARQWDRAILQLQVFGQLDGARTPVVQAYRDLLKSEKWRERVMQGHARPGHVFDDEPAWMHALATALELTAKGELSAADDAREQALDAAPVTEGKAGEAPFDWIADSDSRLGPICEIMTAGSYRWLAFEHVAAWQVAKPATLIDLIWAPCSIALKDGTLVRGFMPARYTHSFDTGAGNADALALGRETVWQQVGLTGVVAAGRKTWATSTGDIGLFELRDCTFGGAEVESEVTASAAETGHGVEPS